MAPQGLYRTKTPDTATESAFVDYEVGVAPKELSRKLYEANCYWPPFNRLPSKEEYEVLKLLKKTARQR